MMDRGVRRRHSGAGLAWETGKQVHAMGGILFTDGGLCGWRPYRERGTCLQLRNRYV